MKHKIENLIDFKELDKMLYNAMSENEKLVFFNEIPKTKSN